MLKLIKYEFRKAQNSLLTLLGLTAALELYFLASLCLDNEGHMIASMLLLFVCAYAVAIYSFVRGVATYSGELKSRSSYLIFMTPNSTLKIMGSKYLYTFANGFLLAALFGLLAWLDLACFLRHYGEYEDFLLSVSSLLSLYGLHVDQLLFAVLFAVLYIFLSVLQVIAVAYFAITIGHTLFRDKKWRWFPSVLLFFLLNFAITRLCSLFPSALDQLVIYEDALSASVHIALPDILLSLLPTASVSAAVILLSLFSCSWMLRQKVSL